MSDPIAARRSVVFDGDDTLWETEFLYDEARDEAANLLSRYGILPDSFRKEQRQIDIGNVDRFGLAPVRFPTSSVEAYKSLAEKQGIPVSESVSADIYRISASVFRKSAPLYDGVEEVLASLHVDHFLGLLTKGDHEIQAMRIAQSGLAKYFEVVSIVEDKGQREFSNMLRSLRAEPGDSWSVGNSLRSDIVPAVSLGMRAVWIDNYVWGHEQAERSEVPNEATVVVAQSFAQALDVIRQMESSKQ